MCKSCYLGLILTVYLKMKDEIAVLKLFVFILCLLFVFIVCCLSWQSGERVGVMRTQEGSLMVYINGHQVGVAPEVTCTGRH